MDRRGRTTSNFLKNAAFPALLAAGLILAAFFVFQAVRGTGGVPAATSPPDTPPPQLSPNPLAASATTAATELTPVATQTVAPSSTPSFTLAPSTTPIQTSIVITDPLNRFTLTVLPGWYAYTPSANATAGATMLYNFDTAFAAEYPPGGVSIQIGAGELAPGESIEQWLSDRIALETSPEIGAGGVTASLPEPYTLGRYEGFTFDLYDSFSGDSTQEIDLFSGTRVVAIGIKPIGSAAFAEALSMLSTLEILP